MQLRDTVMSLDSMLNNVEGGDVHNNYRALDDNQTTYQYATKHA